MAEKVKMDPPVAPRYRTLHDVARIKRVVPYFLDGDPEVIKEHMDREALGDLVKREDIVAVGVGHLYSRAYLDYEMIYGEELDTAVNRVLYVFYAANKQINPDIDAQPVPQLEYKDGQVMTPFGPLIGSMARNLTEIFGFVLSRYGQIVGVNANGTFEYASITSEEVIDVLDQRDLLSLTETGIPVFFELLDTCGLAVEALHSADKVVEDDDLKNSRLPNSAKSRMRASSKRAASA